MHFAACFGYPFTFAQSVTGCYLLPLPTWFHYCWQKPDPNLLGAVTFIIEWQYL